MEFISKNREIAYKRVLELLYTYLTEASKDNYPIKENAQFIVELLKMREGIQKILHRMTNLDIPSCGFVAIDKDLIAFNYVGESEIMETEDEDMYAISTTFVLLEPSTMTTYLLTQHRTTLLGVNRYDLKYFNMKEKKVNGFNGMIDDDFLNDIFSYGSGIETSIDKVKTLCDQIL